MFDYHQRAATDEYRDEWERAFGGQSSISDLLGYFDQAPLRIAMARIEASKFIGEDGKEYIRFPK